MSVDRSLRTKNTLVRHRNVLRRAERLAKLLDDGKFDEEKDSILGMPKVAHRKSVAGKKTKKKKDDSAS